jgi:hypothetical protein
MVSIFINKRIISGILFVLTLILIPTFTSNFFSNSTIDNTFCKSNLKIHTDRIPEVLEKYCEFEKIELTKENKKVKLEKAVKQCINTYSYLFYKTKNYCVVCSKILNEKNEDINNIEFSNENYTKLFKKIQSENFFILIENYKKNKEKKINILIKNPENIKKFNTKNCPKGFIIPRII